MQHNQEKKKKELVYFKALTDKTEFCVAICIICFTDGSWKEATNNLAGNDICWSDKV